MPTIACYSSKERNSIRIKDAPEGIAGNSYFL